MPGRNGTWQGSKWIRKDLRLAIYLRDGGCCVYCGSTDRLTLDHVRPVNKGGGNEPANLATSCLSCNSARADRSYREWLGASMGRALAERVRNHTRRAIWRYRVEARRMIEQRGEAGPVYGLLREARRIHARQRQAD